MITIKAVWDNKQVFVLSQAQNSTLNKMLYCGFMYGCTGKVGTIAHNI